METHLYIVVDKQTSDKLVREGQEDAVGDGGGREENQSPVSTSTLPQLPLAVALPTSSSI